MIEVTGSERRSLLDSMRTTTDAEVARNPLPDDDGLLLALSNAGFLFPDTLIGHLPSVVYYEMSDQGDGSAEVFVGNPSGVTVSATAGETQLDYRSVHEPLTGLFAKLPITFGIESGHVVETTDGGKYFAPKKERTLVSKLQNRRLLGKAALDEEFNRLNLEGILVAEAFVQPEYANNEELNFTEVLRVATKWVEYTRSTQCGGHHGKSLPRTLTFEEASAGLAQALEGLRRGRAEADMTIIMRLGIID